MRLFPQDGPSRTWASAGHASVASASQSAPHAPHARARAES